MADLSAIIESLNDLKAHQMSEITEALSERTATNVETQNVIKLVMKSGKSMTFVEVIHIITAILCVLLLRKPRSPANGNAYGGIRISSIDVIWLHYASVDNARKTACSK